MKRPPRLSLTVALLTLVLGGMAATLPADAQSYPNKPVRLVLPYAPGGFVDGIGRRLAQYLAEPLGQSIITENRPGAGGINGTDAVARSAADGYTLLFMDPAIIINPSLHPSVPYDFFKQLVTVSTVSSSPLVLVAAPQLPVSTIKELIAYAKANPDKLNYASAGIGTTGHLSAELLKQRTGIIATHVPYKSSGASFPDLMNNKIQFAFSSVAGAVPFTTDNRVKALAVTGEKRSPVYPDAPTLIEAGLDGLVVDAWLSLFAPAGVSPDVVKTLNGAVAKALANPEFISALAKLGAEPRALSAADSAAFVKAEYQLWNEVIKKGNIKPD